MIQIIPENRRTSGKEKFAQTINNLMSRGAAGISEYGQMQRQNEMQALEDKKLEEILGQDVSGLSPEMKKVAFQQIMQGQQQQRKQQGKENYLNQIFGKGGNQSIQGMQRGQGLQGQEDMGQSPQMHPQQGMDGFDVTQLSDEDLARASSIDPNMGRALSHAKDVALRERTEARKEKNKFLATGHKRAEKTLDKADELGQEIPLLESSISAMEDAVVNGDQSFWSLDNLAETTGLELFRTAKGGQFKTAAKTYFINDLKSSGARPNQFIEKQLSDALAKVGRSQEANQTVIESFKFSNDLKKKWHESVRFLEDLYTAEGGYLPGNFSSQVEKIMEPYIKTRQKQYEDKLHQLADQEKKGEKKSLGTKQKETGPIRMMTPQGEEIFVPDEDLEEALSLGAMRA